MTKPQIRGRTLIGHFWIPDDLNDDIERIAKDANLTKVDVIRLCLNRHITDVERVLTNKGGLNERR